MPLSTHLLTSLALPLAFSHPCCGRSLIMAPMLSSWSPILSLSPTTLRLLLIAPGSRLATPHPTLRPTDRAWQSCIRPCDPRYQFATLTSQPDLLRAQKWSTFEKGSIWHQIPGSYCTCPKSVFLSPNWNSNAGLLDTIDTYGPPFSFKIRKTNAGIFRFSPNKKGVPNFVGGGGAGGVADAGCAKSVWSTPSARELPVA